MKKFHEFAQNKTSINLLQEVLAVLQAQYLNYYNAHWVSKGNNYYGNHLLFQRLYESQREQFDTLAEKMVAYFGEDAVDNEIIVNKISDYVNQWSASKNLVDRSIMSEEYLQDLLQKTYDALKESGELSLGLDDYIMATANEHETNLYLLGQLKK